MFQLRNRNNEPIANEFKSNQNEIEYRATPTTPKPNTNDIIKPTTITINEIRHTMNICGHIFHGILFNIDKVKFMHSLALYAHLTKLILKLQ